MRPSAMPASSPRAGDEAIVSSLSAGLIGAPDHARIREGDVHHDELERERGP